MIDIEKATDNMGKYMDTLTNSLSGVFDGFFNEDKVKKISKEK